MHRHSGALALSGLFLFGSVLAGSARTLTVGPSGEFAHPSEAATAALAGDTIEIEPGVYDDCMNIKVDNITVTGTDAVLQNRTCNDKGIITITGNNITVHGLTLQGATSTDLNGAGIRGLGNNLTVTNVTFRDDQMGILATADNPDSTIVIRDSVFVGNGDCGSFSGGCHSIYIGRITSLDVEHSRFTDQKYGHYIKSRARSTVINNNTIQDGPASQSSYLIAIPNGGDAVITNNTLEKGPKAQNRCCAITIGEDTADPLNPTSQLQIEGNNFVCDPGYKVTFVRNMTKTPAMLTDNTLAGHVVALTGPGTVSETPHS
jgi:hypothetical protein